MWDGTLNVSLHPPPASQEVSKLRTKLYGKEDAASFDVLETLLELADANARLKRREQAQELIQRAAAVQANVGKLDDFKVCVLE